MEIIQHKKQIVLYGPPGTGKTFRAKKLAERVIRSAALVQMGPAKYFQSQSVIAAAIQDNIHRLQLHPAHSYEDFIRALHISNEGGTEYRAGFLLRLIEKIEKQQRPAIVDARSRIGDWEAETIIGKNHRQAIVSMVERKTGYTLIRKVERQTAEAVTKATTRLLKPHRRRVHTITSDNGREFAGHEEISKQLDADFYFAHPYASWERGTNENTKGLIRQYFPKNRDFTTITQQEIDTAMERLNSRPRKRLGYHTPNQVFFRSSVALHI